MIPELIELITCDPGILEGIPVISGTLVPVRMLLEYRRAGQPLYEFLFDFPTVSRKQAKKLWAWISRDGEAAVHATLQRLTHKAGKGHEQAHERAHEKGHEKAHGKGHEKAHGKGHEKGHEKAHEKTHEKGQK